MMVSAFLYKASMLRNFDVHCCILVETWKCSYCNVLFSTHLVTAVFDICSSFSSSAFMFMITVFTLPYRDGYHRIFQIYVLDVQVWYTVASALLGGLEGARDKLGEVIPEL